MHNWSFVTNHWGVIAQVAKHPQITMREIAAHLGITERSVHRIISHLETDCLRLFSTTVWLRGSSPISHGLRASPEVDRFSIE